MDFGLASFFFTSCLENTYLVACVGSGLKIQHASLRVSCMQGIEMAPASWLRCPHADPVSPEALVACLLVSDRFLTLNL